MSYDVFLSHNRADKAWTRELCAWLQHTDYNGRSLRAWLDEQVLDPDDPAANRQLETGLDRSRFLGLVLSPEALASRWLDKEIDYFLRIRPPDRVLLLQRRPCAVPDRLALATHIDWPEGAADAAQRERLLQRLRPAAWDPTYGSYENFRRVKRVWSETRYAQPSADVFDPSPSARNSALLELLLANDLGDLDQEGAALTDFDVVGRLTAELDAAESYHLKMVLAEYLAIALLRDARYGRVGAAWVARDFETAQRGPSFNTWRNRALANRSGPASTTNLLFAVARAGSKLAETDPGRIDLSTLWAVLHALDQRPTGGRADRSQQVVIAALVGRTLGKLRSTELGEALLHALVASGGPMSHVAAAGAIGGRFDADRDLVHYTVELAALAANPSGRPPLLPPSPATARLLLDRTSPLWTHADVHAEVDVARADLVRFFGEGWPSDDPIAATIRPAPRAAALVNGPLVGRVHRITRSNMEALADALGPADIACLAEPFVVDALFERVSGYVVDEAQRAGPLGTRLTRRAARFATMPAAELAKLDDGAVLALWPGAAAAPPDGIVVGPVGAGR